MGTGCASKKKGKKEETKPPMSEIKDLLGDLKKRIRKHVGDKGRRDQAHDLLEQTEEVLMVFRGRFTDLRSAIALLPKEKRRDRGVIEVVVSKHTDLMNQDLRTICEQCMDARSILTREEWPLVFPSASENGGAA